MANEKEKEEKRLEVGKRPGPAKVSLEEAIDGFQEAFQVFEDAYKRDKTAIMALSSRLTDLRNEKERFEKEISVLKDKAKAFNMEISDITQKVEARKKELKELINT